MVGDGAKALRWMLGGVLLLLSGVLVLGLLGLRASADQAVDVARAEAERAARARADGLRERLASPGFLATVGPPWSFGIDGRAPSVPPEVAWLERPPGEPDPPLSSFTAKLVHRAVAAEFEHGRPAEAVAWWEEAMASTQDPALVASLALRAAWAAHRGGLDAERDARLAEAGVDGRPLPGALPLHAAAGAPVPEGALLALARLDDAAAEAVLARARDLVADADEQTAWTGLAEGDAAIRARRRLLRRVAPALGGLPPEAEAGFLPVGDGVLLYDLARGRGAWLPRAALLERLRAEVPDPGRLVVRRAGGDPSLPVIAGVGVLPREPEAGSGRLALPGLLVVLAVVLAGVVFTVVRATWREAEAARQRAEFLTTVTHELKTPLASIRLLAEMLDQGRVEDEAQAREYYRLLAGEAARLGTLVESVLDLGRLERGERAYDPREHTVRALLEEAIEVFRPLARGSGLELEVVPVDAAWRTVVDRGAVVQAMLNLMENARKYAAAGGLLRLSGHREGGRACIRFEDRGPGIPPGDRSAVFERFRRGAGQSEGAVPGLGLGLYLARGLLRDQGGDLRLEARSAGACFVVELPLASTIGAPRVAEGTPA